MSDADTTPAIPTSIKEPLKIRALLWVLAFVLAFTAMNYQRTTGPTKPMRGEVTINGQTEEYALIRTQATDAKAKVSIPDLGEDVTATLNYRRYPLKEEFATETMTAQELDEKDVLAGELPIGPAAGKFEYFISIEDGEKTVRLPEDEAEFVVLRYKDPVPWSILGPHIVMMTLVILIGLRASLAAMFAPSGMRLYSWMTLGLMTVGGMILGPIVQKYAFGEYWTGFPLGGDWTDNKMLVQWLAWLFACGTIGFSVKKKEVVGRITVILACIAMIVAYMIPHSMGGSQVDWEAIDRGVDSKEAIKTGKQ